MHHEAAHLFSGLLLHSVGGMGVGTQGKACVIVAQHTGYCFYIDAVLESHGCERMPKIVKSYILQSCIF